MYINERNLGRVVAATVIAILLLDVVFAVGPLLGRSSPGGPFTDLFLLALIAAVVVAVSPLLFRGLVKLNLRAWKVMNGAQKSHFLSDLVYHGIVTAPTLGSLMAGLLVLSGRMEGLFVAIVVVLVTAGVYSLMLFPFHVVMGRVHERYNKTTLDRLAPLDYQWSWASFILFYRRILGRVYRRHGD